MVILLYSNVAVDQKVHKYKAATPRGEISSNLYHASVCDIKKGTFFVNKFIQNFVLHT